MIYTFHTYYIVNLKLTQQPKAIKMFNLELLYTKENLSLYCCAAMYMNSSLHSNLV